MRLPASAERVIWVVVAAAGAALVVGEFLTLFRVTSQGVELQATSGGDAHSYALGALGGAVLVAAVIAGLAGSYEAAFAAALCGLAALGVLLIADLPDVTASGSVGERLTSAEAAPAVGFWLQLGAAAIAAVDGTVLGLSLRAAPGEEGGDGEGPRQA